MSMKLYVGNLAFQTTDEDLLELFSQAGAVESAQVVMDRDTGRSRGFGFVEMASKSEGDAAIAQFNGVEINGRSLTVNEARPRESRGGGGGFGGGGRGGGRGGRGGGGFGGGRGNRYRDEFFNKQTHITENASCHATSGWGRFHCNKARRAAITINGRRKENNDFY